MIRAARTATAFALVGAATLSVALLAANNAAAQSPPSGQSSPSSGSSSTSDSSGSPGSTLGGYQTTATGSGVTWSYEQPNFPVPATPTMEANLGYSTATYNAGPTGESLASVFWPGQVAAGVGQELGTLLQPYFGNTANDLPQAPWPVEASGTYPPGPDSPSSASQDGPGVTMDASSTEDAGTATSGFDTSYLDASGFISVQSMESSVESTVENGDAVAQATSEVHGLSIAGGLITIGQVTSTATSTSDGNQAQVNGTSTASQVSVAGEAATLDSSGLQLVGDNVPLPGSAVPSIQKELESAGISLTLTNPTDTVSGASGERELDGVEIQINLTTLDEEANKLLASLPQKVQQQVIDQLPLPPPDEQILTVDLGWVNVQAAASPPYNPDLSSSAATQGLSGSTSSFGGTGFSGPGGTSGASPSSDFGGSPGTSSPSSPPSSPPSDNGFSPVTSSVPAGVFRGIGGGLIALGVILALLLAGALWRADRAVAALTGTAPCVGEHPQNF